MSRHTTEWLSAYLDGELHGSQLLQVEEHLSACEVCQTELQALETVSVILKNVPAPGFTSAERLSVQVNMRLPRRRTVTSGRRFLEIGWWMIPVGLLAVWVFLSTSLLMSDLLSTANGLGLVTRTSGWSIFGSSSQAYWSHLLGQFGLLSGSSLDLAALTEAITRASLLPISLQVSIALLYMSWIAVWWIRHRRQSYGQVMAN